jgi:hypothetical protein
MVTDETTAHDNTSPHSHIPASEPELPNTYIHVEGVGLVKQETETMVLVKQSDMERMKQLIISMAQDKADKEAFADVTRRLMFFFSGIPTKTPEIKRIIQFFDSCFAVKNGKRQFSIIRMGKKLITGEFPMQEISSLGDAVNVTAFDNFKPIDYGDAFQRNKIPMIDITPILDVAKPFFNHEKDEK